MSTADQTRVTARGGGPSASPGEKAGSGERALPRARAPLPRGTSPHGRLAGRSCSSSHPTFMGSALDERREGPCPRPCLRPCRTRLPRSPGDLWRSPSTTQPPAGGDGVQAEMGASLRKHRSGEGAEAGEAEAAGRTEREAETGGGERGPQELGSPRIYYSRRLLIAGNRSRKASKRGCTPHSRPVR